MRIFTLLFLSALLLYSCNNNEPTEETTNQEVAISEYLSTNQINNASRVVTDEGGVFYSFAVNEVTDNAAQSPGSNDVVTFTYQVELLDGTVIASASSSPEVLAKVGAGAIFPTGIDAALLDSPIREGETYTYIFTSTLAYGAISANGLFESNSPMVITINLIDVAGEQDILANRNDQITTYISSARLNDTSRVPVLPVRQFQNGGVSIKTTTLGTGIIPNTGSTITFTYDLSYLDSTRIASVGVNDQIEYTIGGSLDGQGASIVSGLEAALLQMRQGERALVILAPQAAYLESAQVIPTFLKDEMVENMVIPAYADKVDPYSVLRFDVILRSVN